MIKKWRNKIRDAVDRWLYDQEDLDVPVIYDEEGHVNIDFEHMKERPERFGPRVKYLIGQLKIFLKDTAREAWEEWALFRKFKGGKNGKSS